MPACTVPVDAGHTGHIILVAHVLRQQPVADLPRKHGGVLAFVLGDGVHDVRRGHLGLAAADDARLEAARLIKPAEPAVTSPVSV